MNDHRRVVPVRVMNVHKSGLQVAGIDVDTQVEPISDDDDSRATVGDWLLFNVETQRAIRRLDRKSLFKRRAPGTDRREQLIAANVDTLFIVSSCNQDFSEARLERYLSIAREAGVMALIVLTKADLTDEPQEFVQKAAKLAPGIQVEAVNALDVEACVAWTPGSVMVKPSRCWDRPVLASQHCRIRCSVAATSPLRLSAMMMQRADTPPHHARCITYRVVPGYWTRQVCASCN